MRYGMEWHGEREQRGIGWHGWYGMAWSGVAWHGIGLNYTYVSRLNKRDLKSGI